MNNAVPSGSQAPGTRRTREDLTPAGGEGLDSEGFEGWGSLRCLATVVRADASARCHCAWKRARETWVRSSPRASRQRERKRSALAKGPVHVVAGFTRARQPLAALLKTIVPLLSRKLRRARLALPTASCEGPCPSPHLARQTGDSRADSARGRENGSDGWWFGEATSGRCWSSRPAKKKERRRHGDSNPGATRAGACNRWREAA